MPLIPSAISLENDEQVKYEAISVTYPMNGQGHHSLNPDYNSVNSDLSRIAPSEGLLSNEFISRSQSTSAREISNILCAENETELDELGLSDYNWIWGQFLSHDISFVLTQNGRVDGAPETINIPIPLGDEWMDPYSVGSLLIPMDRSLYNTSTGNESLPREFPNSITGWLDGSHVYGSSNQTADWLRSFSNGKLKTYDGTGGEFLPLADPHDLNAPAVSFSGFSPSKRFVAGDPRANEHAALTAMHVLFVREHNRLAEEINLDNPALNDEQIYQLARKINIAQMQYITYYEYLPSLGVHLTEYTGFDTLVDPRISNSFATIAFRMGHSQITNITLRLSNGYNYFEHGNISMSDGFWNPDRLNLEGGIAPVLRGAAMATQAANDIGYVSDLRNSMFGEPGFGGLDMCAIDIQRGRDHGLSDYNTIRTNLGLSEITNWSEVNSDQSDLVKLYQAYPNVSQIDPIMGMYAEDHIVNSVLGETMHAIILDQYTRLRDGDVLYFENDQELAPYLSEIMNSPLSQIIMRNSEITLMPCNVMYAADSVDDMDCFQPGSEKYGEVNSVQIIDSNIDLDLGVTFTDRTQESGLSSAEFPSDLRWSPQGPTISLGDCNKDGNDDLWIGASFDHNGWESGTLSSQSETYLFIGDGNGAFSDFTLTSGLKQFNSTALSASWVDYDNDGDLDLYQSNYGFYSRVIEDSNKSWKNQLFENNGDCVFTDVTETVGLGNSGYSSTSVWGDYDNDGDLDLLSLNVGIIEQVFAITSHQSDVFYHNFLAETGDAYFEDFTTEVGGIYALNNLPEDEDTIAIGPELSYKIKSAENPSATASIIPNLRTLPKEIKDAGTGLSWAAVMVDFNNDSFDDILIATDFGISPLYQNNQNGTFSLVTENAGIDIVGTGMGIDVADIDGDLDLDYCQSNYGPNYLFEQVSEMRFDQVGGLNGLSDGVSSRSVTWDCNFIDVDLDGDLDLWFAGGVINPYMAYSPNSIHLNDGKGTFYEAKPDQSDLFHPIGKTMGSVWSDFDSDGDLDVVIAESNTGLHYFENNAADNDEVKWVGLDIMQKSSDEEESRIANGAIVDVYFSGGKSIRQVVKIGSGYAGTKDTTINIGIPIDENLEKVVVKWKDGTINEYSDLELNQYHTLETITNYAGLSNENSSSSVISSGSLIISVIIIFLISRFIIKRD